MPRSFLHIRGVEEAPGDKLIINCQCLMCDTRQKVPVSKQAWTKYTQGESYINLLFPNLTDDEREAIQTGTCHACWEEITKDD